MLDIHSAQSDLKPYLSIPGFEIPAEQLIRQKPDDLLIAVNPNGAIAARCGLWFTQTPALPGERLGVIGHYFASSAEAGTSLLHAACARLAGEGCTRAVGPMDGNTWQRYRLITERGSEPPFFLEPDNPDEWPGYFETAGFTPLAQYYSASADRLDERDPRSDETARRLGERGIRVRNLDLGRFEDELRRLHQLSLVSFADNFLYTPISQEDFLAQYTPIRSFVRPELVLLAEQGERLVGFLFAVPDLLQQKRGQIIDTGIAKTMATHPDHAGIGLGGYLMDRIHQAMHECGYRRAIHALFHEDNVSGKISRHSARRIRRYTLFSRPLEHRP
jgi:GNAT superfamily N-acetyltransferase